jgi:hypothetical protein
VESRDILRDAYELSNTQELIREVLMSPVVKLGTVVTAKGMVLAETHLPEHSVRNPSRRSRTVQISTTFHSDSSHVVKS